MSLSATAIGKASTVKLSLRALAAFSLDGYGWACQCVAASGEQQSPSPIQESGRTSSTGRGDRGDSVFIREYSCNKLLREDAISAEELDAVFGPFERRRERRQKRRIRTKRVSII